MASGSSQVPVKEPIVGKSHKYEVNDLVSLLLLELIFYEGTILILIPLYVAAFEGFSIAVRCDGVFSFGADLSLKRKA